MRLIKRPTTKDKKYFKYEVILPKPLIKQAGFKKGDELEGKAKRGEIKLRKK